MPLRTDRGKKAALRNFWTWPLRSGRHLVVTVAGLLLVITGVAVAASAVQGSQPTMPTTMTGRPTSVSPYPLQTGAPTSSSSGNAGSTAPTTTAQEPSRTTSANAATNVDSAVTAAKNFMVRWVRPPAGTSPESWSRNLAPFVMPEALVELRSINPDNVPATKVTGEPKVVENSGSAIAVEVPTDAAVINVVVVHLPDGRWLVRKWLPVS